MLTHSLLIEHTLTTDTILTSFIRQLSFETNLLYPGTNRQRDRNVFSQKYKRYERIIRK